MGAVYRAEDPDDGRSVAVKVLRASTVRNPSAVQRFRKEARLLAEVRSPYVAALLEVNEDNGIHFLALEFVPGPTLDQVLDRRGRLGDGGAMRAAAAVARALAEPHRLGIVHRDVKPSNIILPEGDVALDIEPGRVVAKLTDFGLARHVEETESLMVTGLGAV